MSTWSQTFTFIDGEWIEGNQPIVGPRTHAFWLASSVFDGARAFEGVTPDLDKHCARLNRSAQAIGLKSTMSEEEIVDIALQGVKKFSPGAYTFVAQNKGQTTHALMVTGPGIKMAMTQDISPGQSAKLTVTLKKGAYDIDCPIPGHKQLGMNVNITVGGASTSAKTKSSGSASSSFLISFKRALASFLTSRGNFPPSMM